MDKSPLMVALQYSKDSVYKLVMESSFDDINYQDTNGLTVLMYAIKFSQEHIDLLLCRGADVTKVDNYGYTHGMYCIMFAPQFFYKCYGDFSSHLEKNIYNETAFSFMLKHAPEFFVMDYIGRFNRRSFGRILNASKDRNSLFPIHNACIYNKGIVPVIAGFNIHYYNSSDEWVIPVLHLLMFTNPEYAIELIKKCVLRINPRINNARFDKNGLNLFMCATMLYPVVSSYKL